MPKFNGTQRELLQNKTFFGGDRRSPNLMGPNVSPSKIKTLTGFDFLFFGGAKFRKIKDRKAKNLTGTVQEELMAPVSPQLATTLVDGLKHPCR